MADGTVRLTNIPQADSLNADATFFGAQLNGLSVNKEAQFTQEQVVGMVAQQLYKIITCDADGTVVTDAFFATEVNMISIGGQIYPKGDDTFTQDTMAQTITIETGSTVVTGDKIIAFR